VTQNNCFIVKVSNSQFSMQLSAVHTGVVRSL